MDDNEEDYFEFPSHPALNGTRLINNYNRVFSGFRFIFSNPILVQVLLFSPRPTPIIF